MSERVTMQDIQDGINRKQTDFYNKVYDGQKLPSDFMGIFKKALMNIQPREFQIRPSRIKKLITKKDYELSFGEVGLMLNIINAVHLTNLYDSIEQALDTHDEIVVVLGDWIAQQKKLETQLQVERENRMRLSGLNNSVPFGSQPQNILSK